MSDIAHRYAIYFAPRIDSAWWRAGSRWLGRCAFRGSRRCRRCRCPACPRPNCIG